MKFYTSDEVAKMTGLSRVSVRVYVKRLGIGRKVFSSRVFTDEDIEKIRAYSVNKSVNKNTEPQGDEGKQIVTQQEISNARVAQ